MITSKSTVFFSCLICMIGAWLFFIKYSVISIEERIKYAAKEISNEKKNNHILKAELKALTSPARIQKLALNHLKMQPMSPNQLKNFDISMFHDKPQQPTQVVKKLSEIAKEILEENGL